MCGRYSLHAPRSEIAARYRFLKDWAGEERPRYNIAPGTEITLLAMRDNDGAAVPVLMPAHWGFRPAWADAGSPAPINARAEKVATSPYFRTAFSRRRALVPANGWYEWRRSEAGGKQPYYITGADGALVMFAGIWEPGADGAATAAIITRPAAASLEAIHPRMPLVLDPSCWDAWLDPALTEREAIREATRPLASDRLLAYPVSDRVNRPAHDDPGLVEPAPGAEPPGPQ